MDVNELLKLTRPLTDEEAAFMEEEVLKLARQLNSEVKQITAHLDPNDPTVATLRAKTENVVRNIELARDADAQHQADDDASIARQKAAAIYEWERLPAYEWNNRFARIVGRLLAQLPKRQFSHAHNLAAQAMVMSICICCSHREMPPGEVVSREELRAYRVIGRQAASSALEQLDKLSQETRLGRSDIAQGRELLQKLEQQFDWDLRELDSESALTVN